MMDYEINSAKLDRITAIYNEWRQKRNWSVATANQLESVICSDWAEGEEHQEWIDTADPDEIADWLASFYDPDEEENS